MRLRGHQPRRDPRHEDVVELEPLGLVDRHDLDRVGLARLHGLPLFLLEGLDRVDVVEEGAQRELALDRLERVHLIEEGRQVARALGGGRAIDVGLELVDDADAPDHLAEELRHRAAGVDAQHRQLGAELLEARAALVGEPLDLVEMLERLGEQERRLLVVAALVAPGVVLALGPAATSARSLKPTR